MFGDPCPDTEKYVEVHYHCVNAKEITTKKIPVPPWFFDLSATFLPEVTLPRVTTELIKEESFDKTAISDKETPSETADKEICHI